MKSEDNSRNGGKRNIVQFVKFAVIGVMNTLVDFLAYTLITALTPVGDIVANIISYSLGVLNSYFFNTLWTFRAERKRNAKEFVSFILVNIVSLGVSTLVIYICGTYIFAGSALAKSIASGALGRLISSEEHAVSILSKVIAIPITLIVNFICTKLFVFKSAEGGETESNG